MKDTKNGREMQDPQIRIEALESDPTRQGYTQIPNYFKYYLTPLIGHKAASVYEMILSFAHGDKNTCNPSLNRLCAHLGMTRQELTGRKRKIRQSRKVKEYYEEGILKVLQGFELLFIEASGEDVYPQYYTFKVLKDPLLLTPEQLSQLPKLLQESHQRLMERCEAHRATFSSLISENLQNPEELRDPHIRIEALEFDPTRRGYTQIPNYFKYYLTPLIGHKAASVYEMILSFAHGDKNTCNPSLNRLCAHLDMTRQEITGREHQFRTTDGKIRRYYKAGMLDILQEHGLLFIEAGGEILYTRSYIFRVLKSPPLLIPEQLLCLPKLIQESHQKLTAMCENDRAKLGYFQSFRDRDRHLLEGGDRHLLEGGDRHLLEGGDRHLLEGGVDTYYGGGKTLTTQKEQLKEQLKQQQQNAAPTHHPVVVVVSCPQKGAKNADALSQLPHQDNIPGLTQSDIAPPPPLTLTSSSLFTAWEKRITSELVPKYGAELVQQYIGWLDFQYRDQPPKKPFTLLAVSLTRGNLIRPEGFEDREELERKRLEKERQREAVRQEEEGKKQEAEARREKLAQAQALFESLPEEEKEVWRQRAIQKLPGFLRSKDFFVENQILMLILEEKLNGSHERVNGLSIEK